mmetsp:Transcript_87884/g.235187  ORF Transcript_87884/g.235187 Transcript_87884/m.235187 type:complete len:228 (-) Transcript_87884:273-956(-)
MQSATSCGDSQPTRSPQRQAQLAAHKLHDGVARCYSPVAKLPLGDPVTGVLSNESIAGVGGHGDSERRSHSSLSTAPNTARSQTAIACPCPPRRDTIVPGVRNIQCAIPAQRKPHREVQVVLSGSTRRAARHTLPCRLAGRESQHPVVAGVRHVHQSGARVARNTSRTIQVPEGGASALRSSSHKHPLRGAGRPPRQSVIAILRNIHLPSWAHPDAGRTVEDRKSRT